MKSWPNERFEELQNFRQLLNDVKSINSGSNVLERIHRCIKLAEQLDHSDMIKPRASFVQFLTTISSGDSE